MPRSRHWGEAGELAVLSPIADKDPPNKHASEDKHLLRVPIIELQLGAFAAGSWRGGHRPADEIVAAVGTGPGTHRRLSMCEWDAGVVSTVCIIIQTSKKGVAHCWKKCLSRLDVMVRGFKTGYSLHEVNRH